MLYSKLATKEITQKYGSYVKLPYSLIEDDSLSKGAIDTYLKLSYSQSTNKYSTLSVFTSVFGLNHANCNKYYKELTDGKYIVDGLIKDYDESFFRVPLSFIICDGSWKSVFYKLLSCVDIKTQNLPVKSSTAINRSNIPKKTFYRLITKLKEEGLLEDRYLDLVGIFDKYRAADDTISIGAKKYNEKKRKYCEDRRNGSYLDNKSKEKDVVEETPKPKAPKTHKKRKQPVKQNPKVKETLKGIGLTIKNIKKEAALDIDRRVNELAKQKVQAKIEEEELAKRQPRVSTRRRQRKTLEERERERTNERRKQEEIDRADESRYYLR